MDLTISTGTIIKIAITAIGTYLLLPLLLVARDYVLWQIIDRFIITEHLLQKIDTYARDLAQWNNEFVGTASMERSSDMAQFFVNDQPVSEQEWSEYRSKRDSLLKRMNEGIWHIQRRSNLVTWLLKHYKQESDNPVKKMSDAANLRAKEIYEREHS